MKQAVNGPNTYLAIAHIKPEGNHQSQGSAVAGQSFIAGELPSAVGHEMDGQEHLHDVLAGSEEIVGLIEQAMPQTGTNQDAQEAIDEQRIEDILRPISQQSEYQRKGPNVSEGFQRMYIG